MNNIIENYLNVKPSQNAYTILRDRYFLKDSDGNFAENDWEDIALRVSRHVAASEILYEKDIEKIKETEKKFFELIKSRIFIPNSPTLFNAGKTLKRELFTKKTEDMKIEDYIEIYDTRNNHNMLSACFVIPMDDSMNGIFDAVKNAALIMKYGGGVGYDFSVLRGKGSSIAGTGGKSSGPISFMHVFNTSASTIEQGGARRAAQMAVLRYDHPDITDFINSKKNNDGNSVLNYFNISVNIDNPEEFDGKIENGEKIKLKDDKEISAEELLDKISKNAWKSGDPGMLFLGRHNRYYAMGEKTPVTATNPCGEEPLPPFGSCNLGSVDIAKLVDYIDITDPDSENIIYFKEIIDTCVRFLDDIIDINVYPLKEIDEMSKNQRFIGLGFMGMADALYKKEIAYDSEEGRNFMMNATAALAYYSHCASTELAKIRGNFPEFENSKYPDGFIPFAMIKESNNIFTEKWNKLIEQHFKNDAVKFKRNVQVNTIAPTGSISNIADTSSGIEPNFMLAYLRYMTDKEGKRVPLSYMNKVLKEKINSHMTDETEAMILEKGNIKDIKEIRPELKKVFVTSMDISPENHLLAQHVIQSYLDASCSKTINMPNSITEREVYEIYRKALKLNLKGITIYRDGSLQTQVLTANKKKEDKEIRFFVLDEKHKLRAKPRKETLRSVTRKYKYINDTVYITVSFDDNGEAIEIFLSDGTETAEVIGRLSSIALRAGVSSDELIQQLEKVKGDFCKGLAKEIKLALEDFSELWEYDEINDEMFKTGKPMSRDEVEKFVHANGLKYEKGFYVDNDGVQYCPSCLSKNSMIMKEGCMSCKTCGWSKCN
ncbi:MAG: adenosylcobalamin-dependent ribonucleoside-diphosphate reductase [Thermotogae bacterium]|nr:adenosylcobalamin-dependent ribonucleoside-diphosphate reductase [Thermotogota bacterium]